MPVRRYLHVSSPLESVLVLTAVALGLLLLYELAHRLVSHRLSGAPRARQALRRLREPLRWLLVAAAYIVENLALRRYQLEVEDNLQARRVHTQVMVLRRITVFAAVLLAGAAMLMTFPQARTVGTSLLASAGIIGLVAGVAARPVLENVIAGVQIAFSGPIRIDDVVVVEGEWGRIEEITLTFVVVRIWDSRRLMLPIS